MTTEERQALKLGQMVVAMIKDLRALARDENSYARRKVTFPGGEVYLFVANNEEVATALERGPHVLFEVQNAIPRSETN